jgi:hypothetical protein
VVFSGGGIKAVVHPAALGTVHPNVCSSLV